MPRANWYRTGRDDGEQIAAAIGDRQYNKADGVSDLRVGAREKEELFQVEDRNTSRFNFSHLYTALSRSQYMSIWVSNPLGRDMTRDRIKFRR